MRTSVDVHNYLVERDVPHELFSARGRLRSPERLAAVLDLPSGDVGKVVVFEDGTGGVAVIVPSAAEPDPRKVRRATGRRGLARAADDRASELTEYLAESIPPAGLPDGFGVVVDLSLHRDAVLYFSGGEVRAVLKVRGTDLAEATGATVAPIQRAHATP